MQLLMAVLLWQNCMGGDLEKPRPKALGRWSLLGPRDEVLLGGQALLVEMVCQAV